MADISQAAAAAPAMPFPYIRSCELCRQRKVKCDRYQPCSHCARLGQPCSYPAGPGRAPKRLRKAESAELMKKLSRLENIIKQLAPDQKGDTGHGALGDGPPKNATDNVQRPTESGDEHKPGFDRPPSEAVESHAESDAPVDIQFGRLVINNSQSYYVGNVLWSNLTNEVNGIRDMVKEAEEDEIEDEAAALEPMTPTPESGSSGCNAALFGFRALAYSLLSYHPSLAQAVNLFAVFTENVATVIRLFHMPTLSSLYWESIASLDSLDKNTEALLFAIYYSATISLRNEQCLALLGMTKDAATERYRFAVEQALARADLLNTHSMTLLQATVLFLSALRNQDDSRTTWSLTALVFYLAQSMGLHRDGTVFGLRPFDTELRRRLWWYICVLDGHSSKYQEYEANIHKFFSDTKLPLHINDADLYPDMTEPPPERDSWTDMTFCLVRCEAINIASSTKLIGPGLFRGPLRVAGDSGPDVLGVDERKAIVESFVERITHKYLRHCDPSEPVLLMSSLVIRLIFARFWLLVYRPQPGPNSNASSAGRTPAPAGTRAGRDATPPDEQEARPPLDAETRDKLFSISIEVLELSTSILTHPQLARWAWYAKTYIQWHAIGYVLAEICCRPPSDECDRAWAAIKGVYDSGILEMSEPNGTVWKPIRRLMAKARYVREMQGLQPAPASEGCGVPQGPASAGIGSLGNGGLAPATASCTARSVPDLGSTAGLGPHGSGSHSPSSEDHLMEFLGLPWNMRTDDLVDMSVAGGNNGFTLGMMGAGSAMDGWDGRMW